VERIRTRRAGVGARHRGDGRHHQGTVGWRPVLTAERPGACAPGRSVNCHLIPPYR
jgi:hypothetical protein